MGSKCELGFNMFDIYRAKLLAPFNTKANLEPSFYKTSCNGSTDRFIDIHRPGPVLYDPPIACGHWTGEFTDLGR